MYTIRCFIFVLAIFAVSSCSEIPENNDPVIGIWAQTQAPKDSGAKHMEREEWIFNDAYMGRYHRYLGEELTVETDFHWEAFGEVYTIHYPGLKKLKNVVKIKQNQDGNLLMDLQGNVLAYRE